MQHDDQVRMVRRLLDHIEQGTTTYASNTHENPVSSYTCSDRLNQERSTVFRRHPLLIGMSDRVREPGDYISEDLAGVPVIVCRDRENRVRAFLNICRHRGARLVDGCGSARRFVCPYHAWTYNLDGKLATIPSGRDFELVDKETNGLPEFSAVESDGLIYVQLEGENDITESLAGMGRDLEAHGFSTFHHYRSLTIRRQMNWKLCPETFMEGYHLQYLHKDSVGPLFVSNLMAFDAFGQNSRLTLPRQRITQLKDRPEADWQLIPETAIIYTFFPNTTFVVQAGHIEMWRSFPDGAPDRCRIEVSVYTPEKVESDKAKAFYEKNIDLAIRTVVGEDFPLSEGIQAGHDSAMQEHVTYGRNEPALIHYCQSIEAALVG
jgi:phenylpropionate dioxygenase-like ring-hydroxylating dioxygenase large terminal subunit